MYEDLSERLDQALRTRGATVNAEPQGAVRLFNGFLEGAPQLAADRYGSTLVIHNHADPPEELAPMVDRVIEHLARALPGMRAVLVKEHRSRSEEARQGTLRLGTVADLDRRVEEGGVSYALDLRLNRDASFYLDTRNLRAWAHEHLKGARVLNAFAYTGSLGVAAAVGGAKRVVHTDLNPVFLNVAKQSYALNRLPVARSDFRAGDFWEQAGRLRKAGSLFDCVILDPPFFSATAKGTVDLVKEHVRVINKARPFVGDGGALVAVNNALYLSGADYLKELEGLGEYVKVETLIPVPDDSTGYAETRIGTLPADPAPFNHATKIAVLRLRRKDGRRASETPEP
jgi:23S rRNA (cytosine1962-C5)-methyltransferase